MQCFTGVIFVLLLIQNSWGNTDCGPDQENVAQSYRRLLGKSENDGSGESEDPAERTSFPVRGNKIRSHTMYYQPEIIRFTGAPSQQIFMSGPQSMIFHSGLITDQRIVTLFNTIKTKAQISVEWIMQKLFNVFMQWPDIKIKLARTNTTSFRSILRVIIEMMYPEWDVTKINLIFSGTNIEAVLRELFIAMFPNWPKREVEQIFSPANNVPMILKTMLQFMIPGLLPIDINYIFGQSDSILEILQKMLITFFPSFPKSKLDSIFSINTPLPNLIEKGLQLLFPQPSTALPMNIPLSPMQWTTEYQFLFPGLNIPTYALQNTAPEGTLTFLLNQLNYTRTMPNYSFKHDDTLLVILSEWLKLNPQIIYQLTAPGQDDFYNFKNQLFPTSNGNAPIPWEFKNESFLRDLFTVWQQYILPKFPSTQKLNVPDVVRYLVPFVKGRINPTSTTPLSPGQSFPLYPGAELSWSSYPIQQPQNIPMTSPMPAQQAPVQTPQPPTTLDVIPNVITKDYVTNLYNVPDPMKDILLSLFALPNKADSFPTILDLLAFDSKPDVQNRVPAPKLFELILKLITNDWPDTEIKKIVDNNPTSKQILKNLWTTMFLDWPQSNENTSVKDLNSPKQIIELFIKKGLPQLPVPVIDQIFNESDDIDTILDDLFALLFPKWPDYSTFLSFFEPNVLKKAMKEIANWPKQKASIISHGKVSIPVLLESFLTLLFPTWSQSEINMIVSTRVPLPLIIQKLEELLINGEIANNVEIPLSLQSSKVKLPFNLFKTIFPNWPKYTVIPPSMDVPKRSKQISTILRSVQSNIEIIMQATSCLQTSEHKWIIEFIMALINFILQIT